MKHYLFAAILVTLCACALSKREASTQDDAASASASIERGKYLTIISGCNDCHSLHYAERSGDVPEADLLTGAPLGWKGPWGTTYAINLRLFADKLTEEEWVQIVRSVQARPPMPSYVFQVMSEDDTRAIYRYLRHLGPAGEMMPGYVPPGAEPKTPYILFEPQVPKRKRR